MNIVSCDQEIGRRTTIIRKEGTVTVFCHSPFFANKRCSKACICGNQSSQVKTLGAVFTWLFLLLDAEQLFYNLSNKRCSISCPSILAQKTAKYEELFFRLFL
ncbi:hypothetical protein EFL02_04865 [Enterococcus faecium]|nr:hypothetical protein [Enterococcus faecium]EGP5248400.1 hypothetical protein [Enterococcus faecium]EGP5391760.1 hypothetical protein [Enterococcus faecium]